MIAPRLGNAPISSASTGTWPASTIALTEAACSARKSSCPALIGSTSASYFAVSAAASDGGSSPTCRTVVAIANSFVGTGSSGYGAHNNSPVDGSRQVVDGVRTHLRRLEIPGHPIRDVHVCVAAHRELIVRPCRFSTPDPRTSFSATTSAGCLPDGGRRICAGHVAQ